MADEMTLSYDGAPVADGEMDTYSVGGSILAFGDFVGIITEKVYGSPAEVRTRVRGIERGSFDIQFAIHLLSVIPPLFGGSTPLAFVEYVKNCLELYKHLKGEPPRSVQRIDNQSGGVRVESNHGTIIIVQPQALDVVSDNRAGKAVDGFVRRPLSRGLDRVSLVSDERPGDLIEIAREDAQWFRPIEESEDERSALVSIAERWLFVESVHFVRGRRAWRFNDGQSSFAAHVADERFMGRFAAGSEMFAMGDQLRVRLETRQIPKGRELKTTYEVLEIFEHRHGMRQMDLI